MRDLVLSLATLIMIPVSVAFPGAGILAWAWFSIESPHQMVYGFANGKPLNSLVAAATILGWLMSKEPKRWPGDAMPWLLMLFVIWMTFNMFFVPFPDWSWPHWNTFSRVFVEVFFAFFLLTTKARIQGMVWTLIIALGFYGTKGGVFTILHAGHGVVWGPPGTMIGDNNQIALAMVMVLPLVYYAYRSTAARWLRIILLIALGLEVLMVFGSYSRGGVLALGVMLLLFWLRSDRKILYALLASALVAGGLGIMPDSFWNRMDTLHNVEGDSSFMGRVMAWKVATAYAIDHFPFGAGFYAPQLSQIFNAYFPDEPTHAAHSIYFQVLGEHGFIGLALYLVILLQGLRNAGIVIRQCRGRPDFAWARDLAELSRVSLIAFYFGGAALSMAYFDGYLLQYAILSNLRRMTAPAREPLPQYEMALPADAARGNLAYPVPGSRFEG